MCQIHECINRWSIIQLLSLNRYSALGYFSVWIKMDVYIIANKMRLFYVFGGVTTPPLPTWPRLDTSNSSAIQRGKTRTWRVTCINVLISLPLAYFASGVGWSFPFIIVIISFSIDFFTHCYYLHHVNWQQPYNKKQKLWWTEHIFWGACWR